VNTGVYLINFSEVLIKLDDSWEWNLSNWVRGVEENKELENKLFRR
jgi:hypothetical protein